GTKAFVIIPDQGDSSLLESSLKNFFARYLNLFKNAQAANAKAPKIQMFDLINNKLLDTLVVVDERIRIDTDSCVSTSSMGPNIHYYIVDNNRVLKQCVNSSSNNDALDVYDFSRASISRLYTFEDRRSYFGKWNNRVFVYERDPHCLTFIDLDNLTNPPTTIVSAGTLPTQYIGKPGY
ncbi:MAG: hypothetical protein COS89_05945, partial [Deltaproteobacteria bacterium CG07_land_8_20_14_0_80_38_7]